MTAASAERTSRWRWAASMFRMAHVFLVLGRMNQAQHVAASTAQTLEPRITAKPAPEVLSLYGGLHLVLAVAAARDNDRSLAHLHLDTAREIAEKLGADRNDYGTEFGPANVAVHAVNIAVELGDAGQAIELGQQVNLGGLSPERQARYYLISGHGPSCANSPNDSASCPSRRLRALEGLGGQGGQAERVTGRISVDAAVIVRLDVVL